MEGWRRRAQPPAKDTNVQSTPVQWVSTIIGPSLRDFVCPSGALRRATVPFAIMHRLRGQS